MLGRKPLLCKGLGNWNSRNFSILACNSSSLKKVQKTTIFRIEVDRRSDAGRPGRRGRRLWGYATEIISFACGRPGRGRRRSWGYATEIISVACGRSGCGGKAERAENHRRALKPGGGAVMSAHGHFFDREAQRDHGPGAGEGYEARNRRPPLAARAGPEVPPQQARPAGLSRSGFCVSARCGVRPRLFLAPPRGLPQGDHAGRSGDVLARQVRRDRQAGRAGSEGIAPGGVGGADDLGVRGDAEGSGQAVSENSGAAGSGGEKRLAGRAL